MKIGCLSEKGTAEFRAWLDSVETGLPPAAIQSELDTELEVEIDKDRKFSSRYELGAYLVELLAAFDFVELMAPKYDGMWNWLSALFFSQLALGKRRRAEHYVVVRNGTAGSLAYRHGVRTSFEMTFIHGENARLCLSGAMNRWGELAEQLTSRQSLAHSKAFFETAHQLYMPNGTLVKGVATKPKKPSQRKLGDKGGLGGARRLALALQRLDLTFDTEAMSANGLVALLPKEFSRWGKGRPAT